MSAALNQRLEFMELDSAAQQRLAQMKPLLLAELPGALSHFYGQVRRFPETSRFFSSDAQIGAASKLQGQHWDSIASGRFDDAYEASVTKIGEVHARIGLEPRWYIGGYAMVLEVLVAKVIEARWPKGGFGAKRADPKDVGAEVGAVIKATLLDMDLAISVYLSAAERARIEAEKATLAREREQVVGSVGTAMTALAHGDLTYRMPDNMPAEYAQMRDDFNGAMAKLEGALSDVFGSAGVLANGANEIASASDDLARRTEQQAASLEETAAALDQITAIVRRSAEGARQANGAASTARADAVRSGVVVQEAEAAMAEIRDSSGQVNQIIGVIDEIAFQTNLLALNAGVEAARAGDAGRGFAVVAAEVRALAQRSATAAKEIKALISSSSDQVQRGVKLVGETGEALRLIVGRVAEIDQLVGEIAQSAQEQSLGLSQVNTAVNQMDQVTQQNAAMVEEATAAAASLSQEADRLIRSVSTFKTGDGHGQVGGPVAVAHERIAAAFAR